MERKFCCNQPPLAPPIPYMNSGRDDGTIKSWGVVFLKPTKNPLDYWDLDFSQTLQGHLAHKKQPPRRTLQQDHAHMAVPGGGGVL